MEKERVVGEAQRSERADVVVIGGGPAGSAAALRLARNGRQVIQLERRVIGGNGSDRLRSGEGLIPRTLREIAALGIDHETLPCRLSQMRHVRIHWPNGSRTTDQIGQRGGIVQIDRERLDGHLFAAAQAAGVDGRQNWRVIEFVRRGDAIGGVVARSPDGATHLIRSPIVIDAGGRNALSLRTFDLRRSDPLGDFFGMSMFFDHAAELDPATWETHMFDPDRLTVVQLSQMENGVVRCGLGTQAAVKLAAARDPQTFFWERISQQPDLAARLGGSRVLGKPWVRANIGYRVRRVVLDGLLLAGDAAGYCNPLFGDGILRALQDGRHAAETIEAALQEGDPSARQLQRYALRHLIRDRRDWLAKQLMLSTHRAPCAIGRIASQPLFRHAMLAALMRA